MKSLMLAASVAALAVASAVAPASAQDAVGSVGVAYVNSQADLGPLEAEADGAVLDATVALPAFGDWTVTLNGASTFADSDFGDDTSLSGAAHLSKIFGGDLRVGGFVGAADAGDDTLVNVGAEVQKYLAKATLTGAVSYGTVDDADIWTVGGDAAFYLTPALRLNGGVSYSTVDVAGGDTDAWSAGVGAEYQIATTPFSVYGGYDRTSLNDVDLDVDTFQIGFRYSFGGDLQTQDRAGANLGRSIGGVAGALRGL